MKKTLIDNSSIRLLVVTILVLSIVGITIAETTGTTKPNPGHSWAEIGGPLESLLLTNTVSQPEIGFSQAYISAGNVPRVQLYKSIGGDVAGDKSVSSYIGMGWRNSTPPYDSYTVLRHVENIQNPADAENPTNNISTWTDVQLFKDKIILGNNGAAGRTPAQICINGTSGTACRTDWPTGGTGTTPGLTEVLQQNSDASDFVGITKIGSAAPGNKTEIGGILQINGDSPTAISAWIVSPLGKEIVLAPGFIGGGLPRNNQGSVVITSEDVLELTVEVLTFTGCNDSTCTMSSSNPDTDFPARDTGYNIVDRLGTDVLVMTCPLRTMSLSGGVWCSNDIRINSPTWEGGVLQQLNPGLFTPDRLKRSWAVSCGGLTSTIETARVICVGMQPR